MWIPNEPKIAVLPMNADRFSSLKYSLARTGHGLASASQLMRYSIVVSAWWQKQSCPSDSRHWRDLGPVFRLVFIDWIGITPVLHQCQWEKTLRGLLSFPNKSLPVIKAGGALLPSQREWNEELAHSLPLPCPFWDSLISERERERETGVSDKCIAKATECKKMEARWSNFLLQTLAGDSS